MKFEMPRWIDIQSFKMFIRFLYLGTFNYGCERPNMNFQALFELYRTSWYFKHPILQDHVVVDGLIPKLTLKDAIYALGELKLMVNEQTRESQVFLKEYCMHVIALKLPYQLMSEKVKLCSLENIILQQIICKAIIFFQGDDDSQVDVIMKFTAETFAQSNVSQLMKNLSKKYLDCQGFDSQNIKQMGEFIRSLDPSQDSFCNLIRDDNYQELQQNKQLNTSLELQVNDFSIDLDNGHFDQDKNFDPKKNFETDMTGKPKEPTCIDLAFKYQIKQEDLKKQHEARSRDSPEGISIVTRSFDTARRSWHLKLDFDTNMNLSIFIIERGIPQEKQGLGENVNTPQFSSVLFTIEVMKKKIPIFFSFAHNTQQVIGVKNFATLSHLSDADSIDVKIYAKESIIHSALSQYMSNNFTKLFRQAAKSEQSCQSLFTLQASTVYSILMSNQLKVDDENTVLTFIYNYARGRHIQKLYPCIRYSFVDISKLFAAIKQNQHFAESNLFKKKCEEEMNRRTTQINCCYDEHRKYYDLQKIKGNSKQGQVSEMLKDIIDWAAKSTKNQNSKGLKPEYEFKRQPDVERRKVDQSVKPIHLNNLCLSKIETKPSEEQKKQGIDIFGFKSSVQRNPFKLGALISKPNQDHRKREPPKFLQKNKENQNPNLSANNSLFSVKLNMNETIKSNKNDKTYGKIFDQINNSPPAVKKEPHQSVRKTANSAEKPVKKDGLQFQFETKTKMPIAGKKEGEGGIINTFAKMFFN